MVNTHLLPAGLHDLLPDEAEAEARAEGILLDRFRSFGYRLVKPPLAEFEDGLLALGDEALSRQSFRLLDPASQRLMALRADHTLQIGRIAATRLGKEPRPLRLAYAGEVLRVSGGPLRPERQFRQVGAELIGSLDSQADAEIIIAAASGLQDLGVTGLSVDISLPNLAETVFAKAGVDATERERLRAALNQRDRVALTGMGAAGMKLAALTEAAGPAHDALPRLRELDLPDEVTADIRRLASVVAALDQAVPDLQVTVDPIEWRGFEYQTGLSFTLFARRVRGELGRGGRYRTLEGAAPGEAATGVTLYMDSILRALPSQRGAPSVLVRGDWPHAAAERLRAEGWIVVRTLADQSFDAGTARSLGCSHLARDVGQPPLPLQPQGSGPQTTSEEAR